MSKGNDPAFPNREGDLISATDTCTVRENNGVKGGLTKLEYFAGLAMQGLCTRPDEDFQTWDNMAVFAVTVAQASYRNWRKANDTGTEKVL